METQNSTEELFVFIRNIIQSVKLIFSKWKLILFVCALGSGLGILKSILSVPQYTAKLTFIVDEEKKGNSSQFSALASQFGISNLSGGNTVYSSENLIEYLKSRNIIEKTLLSTATSTNSQIIDKYIQIFHNDNSLSNSVRFNIPRESFTREMDSILNQYYKEIINNQLNIEKADKKLDIITISYTTVNQEFSKLFVDNLIKIVSDNYIESKTKNARKNVMNLQSRVDSIKRELDASLSARAITADQNLLVVRQKANVGRAKQEVQVQIQTVMYSELIKNLEMAKFNLVNSEPIINIIDTPILPLDQIKLSKTKGILIGAVLGFLISIFSIILSKIYKTIYN